MDDLLILSHNELQIKVLPHIGATIVSVEKNGGGNILKSDSSLWNDPHKPALDAFSDFKAYNGHTIWVSPQSRWWVNQDINTQRRDSASPWPPDPFMAYGSYQTLYKDSRKAALKSPFSPISGIEVTKEIAINDDNSIFLNTTFTNLSGRPLSWDIWYNTRVDGFCRAFVPVSNVLDVRLAHFVSDSCQAMPLDIKKGFFSFVPLPPSPSFSERSSKAFIYPSAPWIAAFVGSQLFIVSFELHGRQLIHPEQALVEIYNHTELQPDKSLLELEYHSPFTLINPGNSIEAWEVWRLFDYNGTHDDDDMIAFLGSLQRDGTL